MNYALFLCKINSLIYSEESFVLVLIANISLK